MQTEKNIYTLYKNKTNRFIDFISMFKIPNIKKTIPRVTKPRKQNTKGIDKRSK